LEIVSGYTRKCKSSVAGVKGVWIMKYLPHALSQIVTEGNKLVSFPEVFIYRFESVTNVTANEVQEVNEGGKYWKQSLSLSFSGADASNIDILRKVDTRVLIQDNNGLYRVYGLYNGMRSDNLTYTTGGAKTDFNGIKIDFEGLEEKQSVFVDEPFEIGFIEEGFDYYLEFEMYG
jgi:hypothetical protein